MTTSRSNVINAPRRKSDSRDADRNRLGVRPQSRRDVVVYELDDEALLFDPETMSTHRLNETALCIWHWCDGTTDVEGLAAQLKARFDVANDEAREHVLNVVGRFRQLSLIHDD